MTKNSDSSDIGRPSPQSRSRLSAHVIERGKGFISALFMAARTAQIHDPSNRAFENAVRSVQAAAEALHAVTGGFSLQFVEESLFLNGVRLRFERDAFTTVHRLQEMLEARGVGGIEMRDPVTYEAVTKLLHSFAGRVSHSPKEMKDVGIGLLGVQRLADGTSDYKIDRRVYAVQSYAKLLLAVQSQRQRSDAEDGVPTQIRVVRVIQDLIDVCAHRPDMLLRLATNTNGAGRIELMSVSATLLVIAMGNSLGIERGDLVDIAIATLLCSVGAKSADREELASEQTRHTSLAALLEDSGVSLSSHTRAFVLEEHPAPRSAAHVYSRLASVALAYSRLVNGLSEHAEEPMSSVDALDFLALDETGRWDPHLVDLLANVLRAFPVGSEVLLDNGELAVVTSQLGATRFDRPVVELASKRHLDLMLRKNDGFVATIVGTSAFVPLPDVHDDPTVRAEPAEPPPLLPSSALVEVPPLLSDSALFELPAVVEKGRKGIVVIERSRAEPKTEVAPPAPSPTTPTHSAAEGLSLELGKTRIDPRIPLRRTVEIRVGGREELQALWTTNLSKGGVFIETTDPLPPGEKVEVRLETPDGTLSVEAEVRHVLDPAAAQSVGLKPGMGLRFVDDPEKRSVIGRYLEGLENAATGEETTTADDEIVEAIRLLDQGVRANDLYQAIAISSTENEHAISEKIGYLEALFALADPARVAEPRAQLRRIAGVLLSRGRRLEYDLRKGLLRLSSVLETLSAPELASMRESWKESFPDRVQQAKFSTAEAAALASQQRFADAIREARKALASDPFNRELWEAFKVWRSKAGK